MNRLSLSLCSLLVTATGCFDSLVDNPCAAGFSLVKGSCVASDYDRPDGGGGDDDVGGHTMAGGRQRWRRRWQRQRRWRGRRRRQRRRPRVPGRPRDRSRQLRRVRPRLRHGPVHRGPLRRRPLRSHRRDRPRLPEPPLLDGARARQRRRPRGASRSRDRAVPRRGRCRRRAPGARSGPPSHRSPVPLGDPADGVAHRPVLDRRPHRRAADRQWRHRAGRGCGVGDRGR